MQVQIHLKGGPCDGRNATVERSGDLLPGYTCKGTLYEPTDAVTPAGRVVYTTEDSQKKAEETPPKTHATKSWHNLMKASLHDLPTAVQKGKRNARALARITRHR